MVQLMSSTVRVLVLCQTNVITWTNLDCFQLLFTIRFKSWMLINWDYFIIVVSVINYKISIHISKPYISIQFRLPFHRYIYTNIEMLALKLHQASTWWIQGCVLSIIHSWESVSFALWRHSKEILSALLALCKGNYRWIPLTKDQWYGTLMFPLVSVWTNFWTNSALAGDLICIEAYLTSL